MKVIEKNFLNDCAYPSNKNHESHKLNKNQDKDAESVGSLSSHS